MALDLIAPPRVGARARTQGDRRSSTLPWLALFGFVGLCFVAAALATRLTGDLHSGWYAMLDKPPLTPPPWLFAPVWAVLYLLMGIAAWLVWRERGWGREHRWFVAQLVLNVAWPALFFRIQDPGAAFAEIVALWSVALVTMLLFWQRSRVAGLLMAPYLVWVAYAAVLNFGVWWLNA